MTYSTTTQVQGLIPRLPLSSTSTPTLAQVAVFIDECNAEVDSALGANAVITPIADPSWFLNELSALVAIGAAAKALFAAFPQTAGPGSASAGAEYWRTYQRRLTELRAGAGIPSDVIDAVSGENEPRSYWTDAGAIGQYGTDAFGNSDVTAVPRVRMGTQY